MAASRAGGEGAALHLTARDTGQQQRRLVLGLISRIPPCHTSPGRGCLRAPAPGSAPQRVSRHTLCQTGYTALPAHTHVLPPQLHSPHASAAGHRAPRGPRPKSAAPSLHPNGRVEGSTRVPVGSGRNKGLGMDITISFAMEGSWVGLGGSG